MDEHSQAQTLGIQSLSDTQLLALILESEYLSRQDAARVAARMLENGGLLGLSRTSFSALTSDYGATSAAKLAAAFELGNRVERLASILPTQYATNAADVFAWAKPRIARLEHEELWILLLNGKNQVVAQHMVARGGVHGASVTVADVLRPVLREAVSAFILVHNHPSGDPSPSGDDLSFTQRIMRAAEVVSLNLVDHVVVGRQSYVSMLERGLLT